MDATDNKQKHWSQEIIFIVLVELINKPIYQSTREIRQKPTMSA